MNRVIELGIIDKGTGKHQSNVVFSVNGIAPTICASYGVKQPPAMIVVGEKYGIDRICSVCDTDEKLPKSSRTVGS